MESKHPELVLYDLASTKNVCFSPTVWRIRCVLNYKGIPYTTKFLEFLDIEPTLKAAGVPPHPSGGKDYTVPAVQFISTGQYVMDSARIAEVLEQRYPTPSINLDAPIRQEVEERGRTAAKTLHAMILWPKEVNLLSGNNFEYFKGYAEGMIGKPLESITEEEREAAWKKTEQGLEEFAEIFKRAPGPFAMGKQASYADFYVVALFECAKAIEESIFQRMCDIDPVYKDLCNACKPFVERNDR